MIEQGPIALTNRDRSDFPPSPRQGSGAVRDSIRSIHLLLCLPWLVVLGWLTHTAWFLCDDAFISFRYARNLLEGHGLVFNPGEYVEGYSNFLWVLELAALWGVFGLRPEHTAPWLSVACTAGTLAAMLWWIARLPGLPHRGLTAWMALGLVCSSATFAVWTSAGGLETRQFTMFVLLAVVGLTLYPERRRALLGVSLSLAAASLTRPEGPLFAACCFGWYAGQRRVATGTWRRDWHRVAWLVVPFVVLVGAHYLFRYSYYGEWLPNTYYAKYVHPWYEMGVRYLGLAAVETGLYLLVPMAGGALVRDWQARRGVTHVLPFLCIGAHMAYLAQIGGDQLGYRPLDVYWPLLAVPAAAGIMHLGGGGRGAAVVWRAHLGRVPRLAVSSWGWALLIFLPVLFYCGALQATRLFLGNDDSTSLRQQRLLRPETPIGWLLVAPGMPALIALSDDLGTKLYRKAWIRTPLRVTRDWTNEQLAQWRPYQEMRREIIPSDALAETGPAGIPPYFVPDLKFIDFWGLTDATIARNPETRRRWRFGHARQPPPGYLRARGVNFKVYPAAASAEEAMGRGLYAVQVGTALWMPFDAPSREWVAARFAQFEDTLENARLLMRGPFDVHLESQGNRLLYVKDRCDDSEPTVFLHVVPVKVADLTVDRQQYGFENHDFDISLALSRTAAQRCVVVKSLPDYSIAAVRTGQYDPGSGSRFWMSEFRFAVPEHEDDRNPVQ